MIAVDKELRFTATRTTADGRQDELVKDRGLPCLRQQVPATRLHELLDGSRCLVSHPEQVVRAIVDPAWEGERDRGEVNQIGLRD